MSKYTTQVRFICEEKSGLTESAGGAQIDEIIKGSWDKIFDDKFPMFDESYRETLCSKILRHYYLHEIGYETVGLWVYALNTKMREIMPYYNQLYLSELKYNTIDPFDDVNYTKHHEGTFDGDLNRTTSNDRNDEWDGKNWDVYSDTPQGALNNVENETYLTNARKTTNKGEETISDSGELHDITDNEDEHTDKTWGKMGTKSYSLMLQEWRNTMLNIDMEIIRELESLFMLLW